MGRLTAYLLVFALGTAAALALVSCGGGASANLLPGKSSRQISENLDQVQQLANEGDCGGAQDAALAVEEQIDALGGVDKQLKDALRTGTNRLNRVVSSDCSPETTESVAPASIPEPEENEEAEPETKPAKKPAKSTSVIESNTTRGTTAPATPTTPTTPTTPATTPTTPATEGGGTGAPPGGVTPEPGGG